ncbi:MAG: 50S ribosomal protein L9 [Candidatus Omnitrophota bacterium]
MEVILRKDLPRLGKAYDVIKVKDGFARNYLLPKALALKVTKENLLEIEKEKNKQKIQEEKQKLIFKELADKLNNRSFTIAVLTNEEEKLYASISKKDIVEAIKLEGLDIEPEAVSLDNPIKELGIYEVEIRLKYDIRAKIKIWVVKE